jgi:hypothetical protein
MSYVRKNLGREARLSAATRAFGVSSSGSPSMETRVTASPSSRSVVPPGLSRRRSPSLSNRAISAHRHLVALALFVGALLVAFWPPLRYLLDVAGGVLLAASFTFALSSGGLSLDFGSHLGLPLG